MFQSYGSFLYNREVSIKGQKQVSEVVAHHEKQNGLVRVRTRGLHDDWPEDALPWVQMKGGFGSGSSGGTVDPTKQVPPIGSKVYSQYEDNSQYHGVYFGGSATDDKVVEDFKGQEKDSYGHADPGGNLHKVSTKEGEESIERQHVKGSGDKFNKDGDYENKVAGGHMFEGQKDGHFKYKGKLILEAEGGIEIRGLARSTMPIQPGAPSPSAPSAPKARKRPTYKKPGTSV